MSDSEGPLAGVRVADFTSVVMGPLATRYLADLGATVIRVESQEGDVIRHYAPMRSPAMSAFSMNVNRNKHSVAVDLKSELGRQAAIDIIGSCDIFVTTMRRAAVGRLGLDEASIRAIRPDIIYCVANGFGSDGPSADKPAYDDVIQAGSGLASMFEWVGGVPQLMPSIIADKVSGLHITYAITAALYKRAMTGIGDSIEVPMAEVMAAFNLVEHLGGRTFEPQEGEFSYARIRTPNRRPRRTLDGWVVILPYNTKNWNSFFDYGNRPDLVDDERFTSSTRRIENSDVLYGMMDEIVAQRTSADWLGFCDANSIAASDVIDLEHIDEDPHFAAVGLLVDDVHPTEGAYRYTKDPIRFASYSGKLRHHAPRLGQHNHEILAELGWNASDIAALDA